MTQAQHARIAGLFRYPVKGLSPQPDTQIAVTVDDGLPGDRRFALALGTTRFDARRPEPLEKGFFLMLRRNEGLAALSKAFDSSSGLLTIDKRDGTALVANLEEPAGRGAVESFFETYLGDACAGRPKLVEAPGHKFTDASVTSAAMMRAISVFNLASVNDLAARYGRPLHPLRFRANIHIDGPAPWAEFAWLGREVRIESACFRCVLRTKRCAAVDVDPLTGLRDTNLTKALVTTYGHPVCSVYLEVVGDGVLRAGDEILCGDPPDP